MLVRKIPSVVTVIKNGTRVFSPALCDNRTGYPIKRIVRVFKQRGTLMAEVKWAAYVSKTKPKCKSERFSITISRGVTRYRVKPTKTTFEPLSTIDKGLYAHLKIPE